MHNVPIGPLALALAAGAAGAAVASSLILSKTTPDSVTIAPVDTEVEARLRDLADQNQALRDRLAALESRPRTARRMPARQAADPVFEKEVRTFMAEVETHGARPVALSDSVRTTLETIRGEERAAKDEIRRQRRSEWVSGYITKLSPQLQLSAVQASEMEVLFLEKAESDAHLTTLWEQGVPREELGEIKVASQEVLNLGIQGVLSAEQFEIYNTQLATKR